METASHHTQTLILEKNVKEFFIIFKETNFFNKAQKTLTIKGYIDKFYFIEPRIFFNQKIG